MDVEAAVEGRKGPLQDLAHQVLPGEGRAGRLGEGFQEVELHGREVDPLARHADVPGGQVDGQVPYAVDVSLVFFPGFHPAPAKDGPDAGDQFPGVERLGQVVVRTQL